MAGKTRARQSMERQQLEEEQSDLEQQPPAQAQYQRVPPPAQPPASSSPVIDELNQLAALHQEGVLSDDEFAAAKGKLLGT